MIRKFPKDTDPADSPRQGRAVRPKLSSTLILLRQSGKGIQFLMGRRSMNHRFMPGKFVFPGGRVDRSDARAPLATDICPGLLQQMQPHMPVRRAIAAASAAIRETYEETGLKLAKPAANIKKTPKSFAAFADNGLGLDIGALSLLARAITPPYHPRRFDTWFFTADATNLIDDPKDMASGELEHLQWVTMDQAQDLDLPMITRAVLEDLMHQDENPGIPYYFSRRGQHIRTFL